jgi:hypothetical protein
MRWDQSCRQSLNREQNMPILIAMLMVVFCFTAPMSMAAQSADVESSIKSINAQKSTLTLDDGKTYALPAEFNFEGLSEGVKVIVYYTVVDGVRVVDDLQVMN